jgi:hypothetical protein
MATICSNGQGIDFQDSTLPDDPDWQESKTGIIELPTISTPILELVVRSFSWPKWPSFLRLT